MNFQYQTGIVYFEHVLFIENANLKLKMKFYELKKKH